MNNLSNTLLNIVRYGLVLLTSCGVTQAATIDLSTFVELGATHTDNLTLQDSIDLKQDELIYNVTPSVELKFSGNRFGVAALGQVQYFKFSEVDEEVIDPRLFTRLRGTLIDDFLYLDSKLTLSKLATGNTFVRPEDEGDTAANLNTTLHIERSFGRFADLHTGYTFSRLAEIDDDDTEVSEHTIDFNLGRNPNYGGVIWGVGASYTRDISNVNEFEDAYVFGKLGGNLTPSLLAEFTYGQESRTLINAVNTQEEEILEYENTPIWNAELNWSPTTLTTLTLGYGERFFGSGPTMKLTHRLGNSLLTASYTREISRQAAALDGVAILGENPQADVNNPQNIEVDNNNNLAPLDQPFVDNSFRIGYKLSGRLSDMQADAVYSEQESISGEDTIRTRISRLVFDRHLSEFLSLRLQYDYQNSKASNRPDFNYQENRFGLKFIYSFDGANKFNDEENGFEQ